MSPEKMLRAFAEAFSAFSNDALTAMHNGAADVACIASGMQAVAWRLEEIAKEDAGAGPEPWTRRDLAEGLAALNGEGVSDEHLERADDLLAHLSIATSPAGAGPVGEAHPLGWKETVISEVWQRLEGPFGIRQNVNRQIVADGVEIAWTILRRAGFTVAARPVEPGEVERLTRENNRLTDAAVDAEAALAESEQNAQGLASDLAGTQAELAETRERLEKMRDAGFNHGYLMAVANIINLHRETVVAADVLLQIDLTIDDAENFELAEYDMEALNRLRAEPRAADFFKSQRRIGDAQEAGR